MEKFKFIDLFCGIGGFHQVMTSLGGECVFASDIDKHCQKTYYKNYGIMPIGDITKVEASDIPAHDVLCGGFPCQAFSIAGKRLGFNDPTKGTLFFDILRIAKHHKPKYLLLENVRNLASHDNGNTWRVIHESLVEAGYNVSPTPVIFSPTYIGVPQRRDRVFIMAVRKDVGELPEFYFDKEKALPCSIESVLQDDSEIENIERYMLSQDEIDVVDKWNEFLQGIRKITGECPLFSVTDLFLKPSTAYIDMDSLTPEKAATARRNVALYNKAPEFISKWLKEAEKLPKFKGARRILEYHAGQTDNPDLWNTVMQFRQSGIRARDTRHFPTLTAVPMTPIVGSRRRKLTPRECARLQSFPDTFQCDDIEAQAYKQFGNSVNVDVVRIFAEFLLGNKSVHEQFTEPPKEEVECESAKPKKKGRPAKRTEK
ncbi:MAG: DNA cytosine methyltransferase [Clostridium sp.]|nr:DNA cytosine methyltransferase [Clostridium sp.]